MEISIKFKPQGEPKNGLVSFSFENIRIKDLGAALSNLPEALAKSYAHTVAASNDKRARELAEALILRCCKRQISQEDETIF